MLDQSREKGIIVFLRPFFALGGTENVMNFLSSELIKRGYRVVYALGDSDNILTKVADGVELININYRIPQPGSCILDHLRVLVSLAKEYRKLKTAYKDAIYVAVSAGTISHFWAALLAGLRPLYFWMHISVKQVYASSHNWRFNKRIFRLVDGTIVITEEMKEELQDLLGEGISNTTLVIKNPLTTKTNGSLYSPGSRRFLYVGRLSNLQKRVDRVIKALALSSVGYENFELVVVGDGEDKEELQNLATQIGVGDHIIWAGWQSNPWGYIKERGGVEALLLTSDYEGYPTVLVEAMANGIPCVAVDCPTGPSDIIEDGVNGILIPLTSDEEIVERLSEVLQGFLEGKFVFDEEKIKDSVVEHDPAMVVEKWIDLIERYKV